jgi:hypothetical protein
MLATVHPKVSNAGRIYEANVEFVGADPRERVETGEGAIRDRRRASRLLVRCALVEKGLLEHQR